jgi:hypothetical protein
MYKVKMAGFYFLCMKYKCSDPYLDVLTEGTFARTAAIAIK